jgi:transposase
LSHFEYIFSIKSTEQYATPKDFAASLGLVPRQNTTGGKVQLGRITKQGDRYARTMLIQAGRSLLMNSSKDTSKKDPIYEFIVRLKESGKGFNVIAVAVANKLARIIYSCLVKNEEYTA